MIKKLKLSKTISLVIVLFVTFLALYLTGAVMYSSGVTLANELPSYSGKLSSLLEEFQDWLNLPKTQLDPLTWAKSLDIAKVGTFVLNSLGTFVSFLSTIFLVLIFLIFMLAGRGKLDDKIRRFSSNPATAPAQIIEVVGQHRPPGPEIPGPQDRHQPRLRPGRHGHHHGLRRSLRRSSGDSSPSS